MCRPSCAKCIPSVSNSVDFPTLVRRSREAQRTPGVRQEGVEQRLGAQLMLAARRFDEGDRPRQRAPLARQHAAANASAAGSIPAEAGSRHAHPAAATIPPVAHRLEHLARRIRDHRARPKHRRAPAF